MTVTFLEPITDIRPTETPGDQAGITHLVCCCNEALAFCGTEVEYEEGPWSSDELICVVCNDLWPDNTNCPRCGCETC